MKSLTQPVSHALLPENGRLVAQALAYTALILALLSGCSSSDEPKSQFAQTDASDVSALGNVEYHTYMLANELFADVGPARQSRSAVVGFVPADTMQYSADHHHPLMLLGQQLDQGMIH